MVDLVKIRKKAREQKESELEQAKTTASDSSSPAEGDKAGSRKRGSDSAAPSKRTKKSRKQGRTARDEHAGPAAEAQPSEPTGLSEGESADGVASGERDLYTAESRATDAASEHRESHGESRLNRFKRTAGVMDERPDEQDEAGEQDASDLLELITFALAGEQYAMDVNHLVEIIVPRGATRVPNASEEVIGIISLRGSIVTLLDLRSILGHAGRGEETEDTRIVVVQHENERIGFIVDKVLRVVKVDRSSIESHPVVSAAEQNDAVQGVFLSADTITIYLDLKRVAG